VLVVVALAAGARNGAPLQFAQGFFAPPGEAMAAFSNRPPEYDGLALFVVVPLMLVVNASALGFWLRRQRLLRPVLLRWGVLYLAASALLGLVLSFSDTLREQGMSVWMPPAILLVAALAVVVLRGATEIRRSSRAPAAPFAWEPMSPDRGPRLFTGRNRVRVVVLLVTSVVLGGLGLMLSRATLETPATPEVTMTFLLYTA
jgi:hypothetical protein